jgi:uncharacterized membrane protein YfcA
VAVPALVYAAGQTPRGATATSLVLVGLTSLMGLVPHLRAKRVRVGAGLLFGIAGVGGSLLGSYWNNGADPDVLLLAFSGLMMVAAFAMCRRAGCLPWGRAASAGETTPIAVTGPSSGATGTIVGTAVASAPARLRVDVGTVVRVVVAGTVVGLLTGFFGVGGGFVIVPALVLALRFTMTEAVGTSLLVIAVNSAVALTTRLQAGAIQWSVVVPFTLASMVGVWIGSRLAHTRDPRQLQRWFVRCWCSWRCTPPPARRWH